MHVSAGLHAQFNSQLTPRLQLILKGIQRNQAISHPPRARLQIMQSINNLLINQTHSYANILIWAACCLAFFGFLRVSEFMLSSNSSYDEEYHLPPADISIDDRNNPQLLKVKSSSQKLTCSGRVLLSWCNRHNIVPHKSHTTLSNPETQPP